MVPTTPDGFAMFPICGCAAAPPPVIESVYVPNGRSEVRYDIAMSRYAPV